MVYADTDMVRYGQERRKKMQLKGKFIQELQRDPDTGIGYYDFFIRPEKKRVTAVGLFRNPDVRQIICWKGIMLMTGHSVCRVPDSGRKIKKKRYMY